MDRKTPVGVLGATGMVGQHFVNFLREHPWFEIVWVGASDRSAGKKYSDATTWRLEGAMPQAVSGLKVSECKSGTGAPELVFSAMDASVATEIEQDFAANGHTVVSNSKNHRMDSDVPLLVPEINSSHLALLKVQKQKRGWSGQIVTNPNCSTVALTMGLAPLAPFGIESVLATTMQAISGAGYPGVPSMDILGNVIPFIGGEEHKMEQETQKILGTFDGDHITPLAAAVSAHCNRVPVVDGHTVTVSVKLAKHATREELLAAYRTFTALPQQRGLPSAPTPAIEYLDEDNRPQPRRDAMRGNGMTVTVGRLRECPVLGWKFVCMGHNTIRGAAGAAILNAELMLEEGLIHR